MKSIFKRYDIIFIVFLFLLSIPAEYYEIFSLIEEQTISIRHTLRNSYGNHEHKYFPEDKITFVFIHEDFYEKYEGFPLKRTDLAELITHINQLGAKIIVCDLLLKYPSAYGEDARLAEALDNAGNTILISQAIYDPDGNYIKIHYPAPLLREASDSGYINLTPTSTVISSVGRMRFYPEIATVDGGLPVAVIAVAKYMNAEVIVTEKSFTLGDSHPIHLDQFNDLYIDFSAIQKPYFSLMEYAGISAVNFMNLKEKPQADFDFLKARIDGKIVIISDTSELLNKWSDTPAGKKYRFEILADSIATILKGAPLRPASVWIETISSFLLLFAMVVCSLIVIEPKLRTFLVLVLFGIYIHFITCFYVYSGLVISMSYSLTAGILGYFCISLYSYIQERKFKGEISAKLHEKQKSLEKAEAMYRSIYENAAEGIFQIGTNGNLISANPSMAKIMGYRSPMDIIRSVKDVFSQLFENVKDGEEFFKNINEEENVIAKEKQFRKENGQVFTGIISGRAVRDDLDNVLFYEGSLQDITGRIQREKAERDREVAEAANAAKSEFLSRMSHEIRNPLNAIHLTVESAMTSGFSREQLNFFKTIQVSSRHLIKIVDEILDLSKIEMGKLELESIDFNLYKELDFVVDLYKSSVVSKNIELILDIDPEVPPLLLGDPYRLGQVLGNLLSNASKFTQQGQIILGVNCLQNERESVRLEFFVEDTGIGMTDEQIRNLFSPFAQGEISIARKYGGSGLGLSICKKMVELMGGKITVNSETGKGTRFNFTADFYKKTDILTQVPQLYGKTGNIRVLVVDDNMAFLKMADRTLRGFSCDPLCVASAEKAYEKLTNHQMFYDLIVMDHEMDSIDGLTAIRNIRNNLKISQIPIIFMTAFGNEKTFQVALKSGADFCIYKPVKYYLLLETILQALEKNKKHEKYIQQPVPSFPITGSVKGAKILLAEDNPINQQVAAEILNQAGMQVVVANNGQEAVQAVYQHHFNAVLMDIQMPEMDGYEASRQIRKNPAFENLPIIAMTASSTKAEEKKCIDSGMNACLGKPVHLKKLFSILEQWIKPNITNKGNNADKPKDIPMESFENISFFQSLPGINWGKASKIYKENRDLYVELISRFSERYAEVPQKIHRATWNKDFKKIERLLHDIKSVSGFLMADTLSEVIVKLENATLHEDIEMMESLQTDLENEFKDLLTTASILENNKYVNNSDDLKKFLPPAQQTGSDDIFLSLIRLREMLKEQNLDASGILSDIIKVVTDPKLLNVLNDLSLKIDRLDFADAEQQLLEILKSLGVQTTT